MFYMLYNVYFKFEKLFLYRDISKFILSEGINLLSNNRGNMY